jgi:hypothetical protein
VRERASVGEGGVGAGENLRRGAGEDAEGDQGERQAEGGDVDDERGEGGVWGLGGWFTRDWRYGKET